MYLLQSFKITFTGGENISKKEGSTKKEGEVTEFPMTDQKPYSGFWSRPGFVNEKVEYVILNGLAIAEGDIALGTTEQLKKSNDVEVIMDRAAREKMRAADAMTSMPLASGVIVGAQYRWPSCTIPYVFDPSH